MIALLPGCARPVPITSSGLSSTSYRPRLIRRQATVAQAIGRNSRARSAPLIPFFPAGKQWLSEPSAEKRNALLHQSLSAMLAEHMSDAYASPKHPGLVGRRKERDMQCAELAYVLATENRTTWAYNAGEALPVVAMETSLSSPTSVWDIAHESLTQHLPSYAMYVLLSGDLMVDLFKPPSTLIMTRQGDIRAAYGSLLRHGYIVGAVTERYQLEGIGHGHGESIEAVHSCYHTIVPEYEDEHDCFARYYAKFDQRLKLSLLEPAFEQLIDRHVQALFGDPLRTVDDTLSLTASTASRLLFEAGSLGVSMRAARGRLVCIQPALF